MKTITIEDDEYSLLVEILYSSRSSGMSWFNHAVKRQIYLNDLMKEKKLRREHKSLFDKVVNSKHKSDYYRWLEWVDERKQVE